MNVSLFAPDNNFKIRQLEVSDSAQALRVINSAFKRESTPDWYEWKHVHGPWGPSRGWVAESDQGNLVAVRLFLPWALQRGGTEIPILRAVDGAVLPEARRQGLFSRLVTAEVNAFTAEGSYGMIFSTSVPASREAYRKLGWTISETPHFAQFLLPTRSSSSKLIWDEALTHYVPENGAKYSTAWSTDSLRWRFDHNSGRNYRSVHLKHSDAPHGMVVRRATLKGVPTLVIVLSWGPKDDLIALARATSLRLKTPLILKAQAPFPGRMHRVQGHSIVSTWAVHSSELQRIFPQTMSFTFADLEGVI